MLVSRHFLFIQFRDNFPPEFADGISDLQFTSLYRVPFPYRSHVRENLRIGSVATATSGTRIRDLDDNWAYDLSGSYGVNLFGYDFYRDCIEGAAARARELGPVLGPYHPIIAENVERIQNISGLDEVSFHMSGTEAVMQAVRLARYHTRKSQLVVFCGSYHGWWDGVQPGIGNRRKAKDVYVLKEMNERTLGVLRTRSDLCFARGTFNSHPYVICAMNEFLRRIDDPGILASYEGLDTRWHKPSSSNKSIKRQLLREMLATLLR